MSSPIIDRTVRGTVIICSVLALYWIFSFLSPVLVPFIVAGFLAYLLNPVCNFLLHTCRLRFRVVCVLITMLGASALLFGLLWLCIPPIFEECAQFKAIALNYLQRGTENASIPEIVRNFFETKFRTSDMYAYLESDNITAMLKTTLPHIWNVLQSTFNIVAGLISSLIGLLYLFFLLLDYERYAKGWTTFIPERHKTVARQFVDDVAFYMCGYFRGQFVIALSNCVMFTLGFIIIGFPMPIALGCFIGLVSFVPYLQVIGIVPGVVLALLQVAQTGENFWVLVGGLLAVYIIVQIIQDVLVTPRVMGRIMGLSPAIILLALSIGAFIGGIGGLIIALPLTTLTLTYYKRYIHPTPPRHSPTPKN